MAIGWLSSGNWYIGVTLHFRGVKNNYNSKTNNKTGGDIYIVVVLSSYKYCKVFYIRGIQYSWFE